MISISGSPAASTQFPVQRTLRCSTPALLITCLGTPIFTPTALGLPVEGTDMAGGPSAQASAGRRSPWVNGFGIQVSAGLLPASNRGVGLLTTMAVGSLTLLVADGFIRRQSITDMGMEVMGGTRESAYRRSFIHLIRFIEHPRLFSFAKTAANSASCPCILSIRTARLRRIWNTVSFPSSQPEVQAHRFYPQQGDKNGRP